MKKFVVVGFAGALMVALAACSSDDPDSAREGDGDESAETSVVDSVKDVLDTSDKRLLEAEEACADTAKEFDSMDTVSVAPDGSSMFIDLEDQYDFAGYFVYECIADELEFSEPLRSSISNTSALQGNKQWSENGMLMQWTYHPDNGLDLSVQLEQD
jgi:hypothetical protein